ncbi:hypothetical protein UNDYM_5973 (plasmid) [Undibacterium sp. YM2]|nr:hypothetical protein UNDYM_5973 [Undibacterium sp. YM2]
MAHLCTPIYYLNQSTIEDWFDADGPSTGVGAEYYFAHIDGRTAYVCVDQGEVITVEVYDPNDQ